MKNLAQLLLATLLFTSTALADSPQIHSVTVQQSSIKGGQAAQATVWLAEPAPPGGFVVELWTDDRADIPNRVTIPAGATHAKFAVKTPSVHSGEEIKIAALSPQSSAHTGLVVLPNHQVVLK